MRKGAQVVLLLCCLVCVVLAQDAVNRPATGHELFAPVQRKEDVIGSAKSFGEANLVSAPKWGQVTSLGFAVWRLVLFVTTVARYLLRPIFYVFHVLHSVLRPVTLLIQLIYHLLIGIPLNVLASLSRTLYPAYLFLGSAAMIGLLIGLGLAVFSKVMLLLLPNRTKEARTLAYDVSKPPTLVQSRKMAGKQRLAPMPNKRSPPSTRSIMSSQPSSQTPTIFEESEASSYAEDDFNTDSDHGGHDETPVKPMKDYIGYKPIGVEHARRRKG